MASGSYARNTSPQNNVGSNTRIPPRATRKLPEKVVEEVVTEPGRVPTHLNKALQHIFPSDEGVVSFRPQKIVEEFLPHPFERHKSWLKPLVISMILGIIFAVVLLSAGIYQRPLPQLLNYTGGKVYDVQVGGSLASSWQSNKPIAPKANIPTSSGPYSVLGKPSINPALINQVLAAYHSPAVGKGQALYDLGVQYGIDPTFALAFFMHESTFGTRGEATISFSLGNLRCIPNAACINTSGQACQTNQSCYAGFPSWEAGFKAWYQLIRNLYVAQWGLTTVDQIIPKYAPAADNNDEKAYIASLKHSIDTWHAGAINVV